MMERDAPGLISFAQKAAHVCNRCRVRKQKCDRVLPRCNRCESSDRHCDYSPHRPMPQASEESEPLVVRDESCSQADLSCRGTNALVQRLSLCADPFTQSSSATIRLWHLLREILDLADFDINGALHAYGTGVHPWCPVLDESMLANGSDDLAKSPAKYPMFSLCMWFLSIRPCPHSKSMVASQLYRTMKQVFAVINCDGEVIVEKLQVGMMIAIFEVTHGLRSQASMTVSNCAVMLQSLNLARPQDRLDRGRHMLQWLGPSLLRLEW
ncbi:hypothetical protein BKA63DRAFT_46516 [Paraphoma chrysanthemicola]|nr:hypothetical protein BKA63DRAFT_46516 [Paraphoma chrysanthemicola]